MKFDEIMRDKAGKAWEYYYPVLGMLAHFVLTSLLTFYTEIKLGGKCFVPEQMWSSLFGLAAGAVGVLFTIFVFAMAPAAGFVEKISGLGIFTRFFNYTKFALFCTLISAVLTLPLVASTVQAHDQLWYVWLSIVASSFFVGSALGVWRVVRIFLVWASAN